ncbi:lantibiotic dehydratase [Pseudoalteromonas fenneropenaei]|uniref:Lantibiotic dehydratase n=1 Tax=Pseudoalteromonas fenneropenaei TaxID=1737459 RepID=A0ABV7CL20_9GAMM
MTQSLMPDTFFVIRTPRLSVEHLSRFAEPGADAQALLQEWLALPGVLEALYLASPSLIERIEQWRAKPDSKSGKKAAQALLKYMVRMCSRATPFGLFSGIHQGVVGEKTALVCRSHQADSRKTRLDMFYLSAIKDHFIKHAAHSELLCYKPNPSHYFVANQCRYIESYLSDEALQYRLSAVESDEYFQFALNSAREGASFKQLVESFCQAYPDAEPEEVSAYIQDLIDEGMLLADIPLPLTGVSPDEALVRSVAQIGEHGTADVLQTALLQMQQLDEARSGAITPYQQVIAHLQQLPIKVQENKLFQSDTYRAFSDCELSRQELERVKKQLELIAGLSIAEQGNPLSQFISQFNSRFEGQFVPLDWILDDESGIGISTETGYEAPLVAGLRLARGTESQARASKLSVLEAEVLRALSLPAHRQLDCITLSSKALKSKISNKNAVNQFPASFAAMLSLYQDGQGNPIIKFNGCYGPSAANLLGRFCHLDDALQANVKRHLAQEAAQSPEVIFAEVVHMPEGRPGNVIARPHLRQYEIVFMADSSLADEYQIPLSDLYVWVEGQQVKLWSKRLNKRVVPRLSSAHNYSSRSLSAYKFLCMLQHQDGKPPQFRLPTALENHSFVPRVMLDNLILSEKTWRIERTELAALLTKDQQLDEAQWQSLQARYGLDEQVNFAVSDNVLQLNLRSAEMVAILLAETQYYNVVELKEVLSSHYRSRVTDAAGQQYNNEVIVPFINPQAAPLRHFADNPIANITATPLKRRFSAGSEWLSLKIYSGNTVVEQLLYEELLPLIQAEHALFDKWFFIRYGDPDWHLRLRFHGDPSLLCGQLLPKLNALLEPKIEAGVLHKVELMTYEREVERYGGPEAMALIESLFRFDSELVAQTCALLPEFGDDVRWRVALAQTDKLLSLFNYSEEARLALLSSLRDGFGREFSESAELRKQLGNRYRDYETQLNDDFSKLARGTMGELDECQQQLQAILQHWHSQAEPVVAELNRLFAAQKVNCQRDTLLGSLLHMHNNRMFKAYGREQEFVVHDLLRRKYFSMRQVAS